jgi:hypothetical protein
MRLALSPPRPFATLRPRVSAATSRRARKNAHLHPQGKAQTDTTMSKFSDFLKTKKIDARRLVAVSKELEQLRPADRALKLLKTQAKAGDEKAKAKLEPKVKPRSGRAITQPTLDAALAGAEVNGPAKTRILRAVNTLLTTKKVAEVTLKDLF